MLVDRMNALKTGNRGGAPAREARPGLDVLLMYEDLSTGLRARRLLDEVVTSLNLEVDFQANLWRFDLLGEPGLLELAAGGRSNGECEVLPIASSALFCGGDAVNQEIRHKSSAME